MTDSIEAKSIEKSLKIIRKALQEENNTSNLFEENALLLNQLVKSAIINKLSTTFFTYLLKLTICFN